jgi:hypothetical protein
MDWIRYGPAVGISIYGNERSDSIKGMEFLNYLSFSNRAPSLWRQFINFVLWLYSPILDLGRFRKNFHFVSVTRSRTVSRTPWTSVQFVARPLLTAPGYCDDG